MKIMLLFTITGILHGTIAKDIVNIPNGWSLMLGSIMFVLYALVIISDKIFNEKEIKNLFGPGIWPYLTILHAVWLISINL